MSERKSKKRQVREEPEKQQARKTLREKVDEFDSDAINTLEYGFYYVNGVLAAAQRICEGGTEQAPADFCWIIDEARQRLDKIRVILGFLSEED